MTSYCTDCIHYKVCGNEGVDDFAMTFCADKQTSGDLEALTEFLNDIEEVVQKHGWTIGMYDNLSENDSPSVIITFIPAIGYDSQFRKFGKESKPND